jgi:hypothetical protein
VVLPRRRVVERTLAWLNRNRRLAKDFEQTIASATAWLFIASIQLFARQTLSLQKEILSFKGASLNKPSRNHQALQSIEM